MASFTPSCPAFFPPSDTGIRPLGRKAGCTIPILPNEHPFPYRLAHEVYIRWQALSLSACHPCVTGRTAVTAPPETADFDWAGLPVQEKSAQAAARKNISFVIILPDYGR